MRQNDIFNEFFIAPNYRKKYLKLYTKRFNIYLPVSSKKQQPFFIKFFNSFVVIFLCLIFKILKKKLIVSDPARILQGINILNPFFFNFPFKDTLHGFWWNGFYEYKLFYEYINKLDMYHYFNSHIKPINKIKYPKNINFFKFPKITGFNQDLPKNKDSFEYDISFIGQIIDLEDAKMQLSSAQIDDLINLINKPHDYKKTDPINFQNIFDILENKVLNFLKEDHVKENSFRIISYFFRLYIVVSIIRKFSDKNIFIAGVNKGFIYKNFNNLDLENISFKNHISFEEMIRVSNLSEIVLDLGSKCFPDPNYPRSTILKAYVNNNNIRTFCYKNINLIL